MLFAQQNTIKTAFRFSRIDFYFVTCFYSLYDICMAEGMAFFDKMPSVCISAISGRLLRMLLLSNTYYGLQLEIVLPQIPQIFTDFFQICLLLTYLFFTFAADNKKERMRNMEKLEDTS